MNRTAALLVAVLLVAAGAAAPVGGLATGAEGHAPQSETATPDGNESAEPAAPGAHLAGVVDVHESEVESEVEGRAFGIRIARADSNESRAAVVAEQVDELRARTDELRERRQSLLEARDNGSISRARFRAEMAALVARSAAVERQAGRTDAASRGLPSDLLESRGINATAIEALRNDSATVAGPGAAEIARSIAGPNAGAGLARGQASPGPPADVPGQPGTGPGSNSTVADGSSTSTNQRPLDTPPGRDTRGPPTDRGSANGLPDDGDADDGGDGDETDDGSNGG